MSGMESGMGILVKSIRKAFVLVLGLSLLASCKPDAIGDCFTSTGPIRTKEGSLPPFENLQLEDNLSLIWHDSSESFYRVKSGRNLLENIRLEVSDQTLTIRNVNRCNWVRSYHAPFEIHLYCPAPRKVSLLGFGDFISMDSLNRNPLTVQVYGPGSKGKLKVNCSEFFLDFASAGEISVEGSAEKGNYSVQKQGKIYASQMAMQNLELQMFGENDIRIQVLDSLWGRNSARARIFLRGDPAIEPGLKASGTWVRLP